MLLNQHTHFTQKHTQKPRLWTDWLMKLTRGSPEPKPVSPSGAAAQSRSKSCATTLHKRSSYGQRAAAVPHRLTRRRTQRALPCFKPSSLTWRSVCGPLLPIFLVVEEKDVLECPRVAAWGRARLVLGRSCAAQLTVQHGVFSSALSTHPFNVPRCSSPSPDRARPVCFAQQGASGGTVSPTKGRCRWWQAPP